MKELFGNYGNIEIKHWNSDRTKLIGIYQIHNTVNNAMLGREIYWTARETTSEPIENMGFTYTVGGLSQSPVMVKTSYGAGGDYYSIWSATYTNSSANTETITLIDLRPSDTTVIYSDSGTQSIALTTGQHIDVTYRHTWTIGNAVNIASSTKATPIKIVTSSPHGFVTDDVVTIANHLTNTDANGTWTITKVDSTSFTLNTSVGTTNAGSATGTATGDQACQTDYLDLMKKYFESPTTTTPISYMRITATEDYNVLTSIFSGGNIDDASVIIQGLPKNSTAGTLTITEVQAGTSGLGTVLTDSSGLSETWSAGETKQILITITWAVT
jgi:hypothetical protein